MVCDKIWVEPTPEALVTASLSGDRTERKLESPESIARRVLAFYDPDSLSLRSGERAGVRGARE